MCDKFFILEMWVLSENRFSYSSTLSIVLSVPIIIVFPYHSSHCGYFDVQQVRTEFFLLMSGELFFSILFIQYLWIPHRRRNFKNY